MKSEEDSNRLRYELCLRCIEKLPKSFDESRAHIGRALSKTFVDHVRKYAERSEWSNPLTGELKYDVVSHSWLIFEPQYPAYELCEDCPYKLEHVAIANKELEETETLRGMNSAFLITR